MIKILFICHGNICRSPMAEFVLRDLAEKRGLSEEVSCASAATSTEETGNPIHPGARRKLAGAGICCSGKRARQITQADYQEYDLLIGMDENNIRNMRRFWHGDPAGKVHLLLEYAGRVESIADPWYTGNFEDTWRDVQEGCRALLRTLTEGDQG